MRLLNQKLFRKWIKNNKFGEASKKSSSIKHAGQRDMCGNNTDSKTLKRRRGRAVLSQHPPARQRKALKLEIPATTEWTEREGTCLGRRNCPFSALMHLFTFLYCTLSLLSSLFPLLSSPVTLLLLLFLPASSLLQVQFLSFLLSVSMSRLLQELCQHECVKRLWWIWENAGVQRRS